MKRGWFNKKTNPVQIFSYERKRFHCIGALGYNSLNYSFVEKLNQHTFLPFLKRLHKKHQKMLLFMDNVGYHRTKKINQYFQKNKKTIKKINFPTYSPELNPIEQQWKKLKNLTANHYWQNTTQIKQHLHNKLKNKKNLVKTFGYLCP